MPLYDHLQSSFAGGELSPRLHGRVDGALYKVALAYALNFQPTAQGSMLMRSGTQFACDMTDLAGNGGPYTRLLHFPVAGGNGYVLELGDHVMRIYADAGSSPVPIVAPSNITREDKIANGTFDGGSSSWTTEGEVSFASGQAALEQFSVAAPIGVRIDGPPAVLRQSIPILGSDGWQLSFRWGHLPVAPVSPVNVRLGTAPDSGNILNWTASAADCAANHWDGPPLSFSGNVSLAGATLYLSIRTVLQTSDGVVVANPHGPASVALIDDVHLFVSKIQDGVVGATYLATPWSSEENRDVQLEFVTGSSQAVLVRAGHLPHVLTQGSDAATWTLAPPAMTPVGGPPAWAVTGYPTAVALFQGRLWLAAGNTVWASRPGQLWNFELDDLIDPAPTTGPLRKQTAGSGIEAKLATKGQIRWLRGRRTLLAGTDLGEFSIGSQTGAVSPVDMQVWQESAFGSAAVQATDIGDQILYVSRDSSRARAIDYAFERTAWTSHDLTFHAEHLSKDIREIHFARDPDPTIVLVLGDGTLACCTYDRAEQVAAWWRVETVGTPGTIVSAAASTGDGGSVLWLAVRRGGRTLLERLPLTDSLSYFGRAYIDSSMLIGLSAGQTVAPGLGHLEGQTVRVVLDGAILPDQTVFSGSVAVPSGGSQVIVGLAFAAKAVTLPPEGGNPRGTAQRARRRWVKAALRLHHSALPLLSGVRAAPDRSPSTPQDAPEPLTTGDVTVLPTGGWDDRGQLTIEQDLPFRTEILALFGTLSVNES